MTSEEMNRAIEFMVQHQAQLAIDMEDLAKLHKRDHELLAQLAMQGQRISELIVIESARLDRAEQEDRAAQRRHEESQKRQEELMQELRDRLDRIFDKLS